ncbi:hypothetical protein [Asticcacaulis sp.]|uniref:hypothetical protein n=1 Tax=Asticcacaulis sp. TaxID=1872648 RepID=UPI003918F8C1
MKKLNGWYRIGLILSVIWVALVVVTGARSILWPKLETASVIQAACKFTRERQQNPVSSCDAEAAVAVRAAFAEAYPIPLYAVGGLLLGWGGTLTVAHAVRWVRAGFIKA